MATIKINLYELISIYMTTLKQRVVDQEELNIWAEFVQDYFDENNMNLLVLDFDKENMKNFKERNFKSEIFKVEKNKVNKKNLVFKIDEGSTLSSVQEILNLEGILDLYINPIRKDLANQYKLYKAEKQAQINK